MNINDEEFQDIDDMGEEENLIFSNDIANEENKGNHIGAYLNKNQQNIFYANQDNDEDDSNVDNYNKESINNDMERDQAAQDYNNNNNNNNVSNDNNFFTSIKILIIATLILGVMVTMTMEVKVI